MHILKSKDIRLNINRKGVADFVLLAGASFSARALVFDAASPFVMAYIAAFLFKGPKFFAAALFAALGILTSFRSEFSMKYLLAIILLCGANIFVTAKGGGRVGFMQAVSAAAATALAGIVLLFLRGQGIYFAALNLLEAGLIFALALVFGKAMACIAPKAKRGALSREELMALAILAAVIAVGAADVAIWHFSLRYFFAALIILLAAASGGAAVGAACGLFFGFLLNIAGFEYIYFAVLLGAAGFGAGAAAVHSRIMAMAAFAVVAALCAMYFDHTLLALGPMLSLVLACAVFFVLPKGFFLNIHMAANPAVLTHDDFVNKVRGRVINRVHDFGAGYARLAAVFEARIAGRKTAEVGTKIAAQMEEVFCKTCPKFEICRQNEDMAAYIQQIAAQSEKTALTLEDLPRSFAAKCMNPAGFLDAVAAQVVRAEFVREQDARLVEARGLAAQQFSGLSQVMYEFARELDFMLDFRKDIENRIIREFDKAGINVVNVMAALDVCGKTEVMLSKKGHVSAETTAEMAALLKEILGKKMRLADKIHAAPNLFSMTFCQQQRFYVQSGVARMKKGASKESGDSFSLAQLRDGRWIAALSDGMGSGTRAKEESEAAIELLEELLERGFQKDIALGLINSALLLKSSDEYFSTLDICLVDTDTGHAEFIKIGAAASYILRRGEVESIGGWTLPIGILENVDMDTRKKALGHGDIVVMMTDGVTDSSTESWVENLLKKMPKGGPQDFADYILEAARENYAGSMRDDATVMVLRIVETRN